MRGSLDATRVVDNRPKHNERYQCTAIHIDQDNTVPLAKTFAQVLEFLATLQSRNICYKHVSLCYAHEKSDALYLSYKTVQNRPLSWKEGQRYPLRPHVLAAAALSATSPFQRESLATWELVVDEALTNFRRQLPVRERLAAITLRKMRHPSRSWEIVKGGHRNGDGKAKAFPND
ncbi:hypothetical protein CYLTODRAFT_409030 [Cylindrobasidium torrendii FP15055 ss-10]|uniref:Uncharacterized protein n=1 Tax=Cylindrobasidium torrendii FP15055 ss-10 TaxID=1314674 RepID=A0A0D7BI37_9AGAR|nr:hypothetical protein CYLTODRAFT_409030 [Cylindrobasidium torrendii FP15055 ss-10]